MNKREKLISSIGLVLFLIPELFWSPIVNFYVSLFKFSRQGENGYFRYNFLQNSDNQNLLKIVLVLQFLGLLMVFVTVFNSNTSKLLKIFSLVILSVLILFSIFATYFVLSFSIDTL